MVGCFIPVVDRSHCADREPQNNEMELDRHE